MPTCNNPETSVGHQNKNTSHCERTLVASGNCLNTSMGAGTVYKRKCILDTFSKYATNDCNIFFRTHFYGLSGCWDTRGILICNLWKAIMVRYQRNTKIEPSLICSFLEEANAIVSKSENK